MQCYLWILKIIKFISVCKLRGSHCTVPLRYFWYPFYRISLVTYDTATQIPRLLGSDVQESFESEFPTEPFMKRWNLIYGIWSITSMNLDWLDSDFIPRNNEKSNPRKSFFKFRFCIKNNACMWHLSAWKHVLVLVFGTNIFIRFYWKHMLSRI